MENPVAHTLRLVLVAMQKYLLLKIFEWDWSEIVCDSCLISKFLTKFVSYCNFNSDDYVTHWAECSNEKDAHAID